MRLEISLPTIRAATTLALLFACSGTIARAVAQQDQLEPLVVQQRDIDDLKAVFATVRSKDRIDARVRTPGTVVTLKVEEGAHVVAGQILALIADPKIALKIKALDAQIVGIESRLNTAKAEYDRAEQLRQRGVTAQARVDQVKTAYDVAVNELKNNARIRNLVRDSLVDRAPERMIAGGRAALAALIDDILDAWIETADQQAAGGNAFAYAKKKSPHRLLHVPLEPEIGNLAEPHRRFVAGHSMRDVEPNVTLKVRDPHGNTIANADDLA